MHPNGNNNSTLEERIQAQCQEFSRTPIAAQKFSIYRVPSHIRNNNESYYEPRIVSIGPYHHGKELLRSMEEHKWRYMGEYIRNGSGNYEDYIQAIREMEKDIRACYFESFNMHGDQFVQTILLDSCFIIQLFIMWHYRQLDPVREVGWTLPLLMSDLIMLENQIPFSVLNKMYDKFINGNTGPPDNDDRRIPTLIQLITESLHKMHNRKDNQVPDIPFPGDILHLLHIYYILFVPAPVTIPNGHSVQVIESRSPRMIPTATELKEFGVTLKKKNNYKSLLEISFKNGALEIPSIVVEESSRSRYLNLIAFEQCRSEQRKHLTSYAVLMDCLINTSKDVTALQRCGIIENKLPNTKEAAKFFHQLRDCAYINFEEHYLKQVFVDVTNYCEKFWPKHRAKLCHEYFSSPWTIFSLGAALIVLVITIIKFIFMFIYKK